MNPIWQPSSKRIETANLTAFQNFLSEKLHISFKNYHDLHAWSIAEKEQFWSIFWDFAAIIGEKGNKIFDSAGNVFEKSRFFPEAQLNFAENLLQRRSDKPALIFRGEGDRRRVCTYQDLYSHVARLASSLQQAGVHPGDRVAGIMPNTIETVIAMLATAAIGAIWSSCSPDFGVQGILDRFAQITPKILITADGYFYNGKTFDCRSKTREVYELLSIKPQVIVVGFVEENPSITQIPHAIYWQDFLDRSTQSISFKQFPFNHPLYVMFSSGTTGKPKCIVHGAGGTLIQQLKELILHTDLRENDNFFYFTTCGWMMWNWMVCALATGATIVLYDGSPFAYRPTRLIDLIDEEEISVFGTSAKYLSALEKENVHPSKTHKLESLKTILSTGSPLLPESYHYVYESIKPDVLLASISGGTDIISCFALGNPTLPVYIGELQCKGLGMDVNIFNEQVETVINEKGELVCCTPFPSMPIGFWADADNAKFHQAYFARFNNIWTHGDYAEITDRGTVIIYGRSDAVLNPGGVRIGTAEIYAQVENIAEILESVAIGQDWDNDVRIVLFVKLKSETVLTDTLIEQIKKVIRVGASPRHVPAKIIQVPDIPRTINGKIVELAVRHVVHNQPVKNLEALANPEALDYFKNLAELQI